MLLFFLAQKSGFRPENPFFEMGPRFVFVPLGVGSVLAPSDLLCDFLFPSYARFRVGTRPTRQKVLPHPTVGAPSAGNSPSASRAGWIKEIFLYNPCRLDGVKVHGLTVLLAPLLPMVREARVLQAGEGRLNITLEGVASNTLVHILALLSTGIGIDSKSYSDCFIRNH